MKTKAITTIMLTLFLASMAFNLIPVRAVMTIEPKTLTVAEAYSFTDPETVYTSGMETNPYYHDDTAKLQALDGTYGPTPTGANYLDAYPDYYASCGAGSWADAITVKFDLTGTSLVQYTAILNIYLQKGVNTAADGTAPSYVYNWHHYLLQSGWKNYDYADTIESSMPPAAASAFPDVTTGQWVSVDFDLSLLDPDGWLTIRLYNARVDYIELELTPASYSIHFVTDEPTKANEIKIPYDTSGDPVFVEWIYGDTFLIIDNDATDGYAKLQGPFIGSGARVTVSIVALGKPSGTVKLDGWLEITREKGKPSVAYTTPGSGGYIPNHYKLGIVNNGLTNLKYVIIYS